MFSPFTSSRKTDDFRLSRREFVGGFTLIELLVVIAIIGVLSGIVFSALQPSRDQAKDAAIKENLANARLQAQLYYDNNGSSYTSVCTGAGGISPMVQAAHVASGVAAPVVNNNNLPGASNRSVCHANSSAWAANVPLKTNNSNSWCVDSSGNSKMLTDSVYLSAHFVGSNPLCP